MQDEQTGWGSAVHHRRYHEPVDPRSRRRCHCGCKRRATHRGMANGLCLTSGCELFIRRWVRDGVAAYRTRQAAAIRPQQGSEKPVGECR